MFHTTCDVAVVGAGPAGLAAAIAAREAGAKNVLVLERDRAPGGILQQCIHPGFGLSRFGEELTGPEYSGRYIARAAELGVKVLLQTTVLDLDAEARTITCIGSETGLAQIQAGAIVLAMGCRERTRGNLMIPGTRPAGLYTAGSAQRLANRQNIMVGKRIVILGSGDIGMIMARRMTLEGADVRMVVELLPYLAGLTRNRVQCLEDFGIPLKLGHTITRIEGERRVTGVFIAPVDDNRKPITESETYVPCDTVLFSVGLIPENELTRKAEIRMDPSTGGPAVNQYMQTSCPAVFACGNTVHVNDLVDQVSLESETAGKYAALYARSSFPQIQAQCQCLAGQNVRYICPQTILRPSDPGVATLHFRVRYPEKNVWIRVFCNDTEVAKAHAFRVNPGEMNHIAISEELLTGENLTVSVQGECAL